VALLQGALIDLGYKLPKSTRKHGAPDGLFGYETELSLLSFQGSNELVADGIAGRRTVEQLDILMAKKAGAPMHTSVPATPTPTSRDYKIGSVDPGHSHDPGAGIWNSQPAQATYRAMKASIYSSLPIASVVIGDDAAKHMKHCLDNSGNTLNIDLEGMVNEVPTAKERYEDEVAQAREFVESLEPGRH
jgi:Putative peptidoglycan binding domain